MGLELIKAITEGRAGVALATILAVKGSSPRHPGSKMLVGAGTGLVGTVGGGRGEARALEACRSSLEQRCSSVLTVEMVGNDVVGPDMVCGGTSTMLIEYLEDRAPYRIALERLALGQRVLLAKRIHGTQVAVALLDQDGAPLCGAWDGDPAALQALADGKSRFDPEAGTFYDPVFPEEKLLILGGGHVGRALAALAPGLGFAVTVVDERSEMLAPGRFPPEVSTIQAGFTRAVAEFPFDCATYVAIMTRGHQLDLECVRAVLKRPYRYAGFMGSAHKTRLVLDQVLEDGCDPAKVAALCAPIGLDIDAETPVELAVAIMAELIAVRRNAGLLAQLAVERERRRAPR
ncbi:MAG: XdhC family protein [Holophaga sp.]|nr:XdhC family protein [Holophaga sp.]